MCVPPAMQKACVFLLRMKAPVCPRRSYLDSLSRFLQQSLTRTMAMGLGYPSLWALPAVTVATFFTKVERMVALGAAAMLEEIGVSAEVVDPRTTWPLDEKTLVESAKKTSRAIVIDEGSFRYGVTGEIASVIAEGAFYDLDGPVRRIGALHVPIPFSPALEDVTVPTERDVFEMARTMCNK